MRRILVSLLMFAACAERAGEVASSVASCDLAAAPAVCSAPAQPLTATADLASAPDVAAGTTYAITGPTRGYVIFTPSTSGMHTFYFGNGKPLRVCDETATCASHLDDCGAFQRAAQYALDAGVPYEIEIKGTPQPFRLHIVAPAAPSTGVKLGPPVLYGAGTTPYYVEAADLDGDQALDLVVSTPDDASGMTTVDLLRNTGGGAFAMVEQIMTSAPGQTVAADVSGDGVTDIVGIAFDGQGPLPSFYLTGEGAFDYTRTTWGSGIDFWPDLEGADFDEDGTIDIVAAYMGGFQIRTLPDFTVTSDVTVDARHVSAGDFDGDGHQDVTVANTSGDVRLFAGDGTGAVTQLDQLAFAGAIVKNMFAADLDADGRSDLVVTFFSGDAAIAYGTATGFATPITVAVTGSGIGAGDFDHDGRLDLAFSEADHVTIVLATDDGFAPQAPQLVPPSARDLVVGDFNGDGFDDLAVTSASAIAVFLSVP